MAKHSLAEHSVSDDERQVSSAKRRRTASSLPRSTPPRDRDGDVDFDPDAQGEAGSGEDDEDEDEDEDMSDDEERRRQAALLEQTQRARPSVRPTLARTLPAPLLTLRTRAEDRRGWRH